MVACIQWIGVLGLIPGGQVSKSDTHKDTTLIDRSLGSGGNGESGHDCTTLVGQTCTYLYLWTQDVLFWCYQPNTFTRNLLIGTVSKVGEILNIILICFQWLAEFQVTSKHGSSLRKRNHPESHTEISL